MCPECLSGGGAWTEVEAAGSVWSFAVYYRALHSGFVNQIPYAVAEIQLDGGPRMVGMVIGSFEHIRIEQRVLASFDPVTADVTLVRWRLV